jgi:hypothetical protein
MSEWSKSIVGCCIYHIESDPKKTPYVSFCGATKCLCLLLKNYSSHLKKNQVKFLYTYILNTLRFDENMKRYTLALNTLEILRQHTSLFQDSIMETDETVCLIPISLSLSLSASVAHTHTPIHNR